MALVAGALAANWALMHTLVVALVAGVLAANWALMHTLVVALGAGLRLGKLVEGLLLFGRFPCSIGTSSPSASF
ncbi:MAG: hypothetical protein ACJ72B_08780 [Ornithinibacter sp.]